MKAVIQRVKKAKLEVDGKLISEIGKGYVIFLGVGAGDSEVNADYFIRKLPPLRINEDENGKTNKSILDIGVAVYAFCEHRPRQSPRLFIGRKTRSCKPTVFIRCRRTKKGRRACKTWRVRCRYANHPSKRRAFYRNYRKIT